MIGIEKVQARTDSVCYTSGEMPTESITIIAGHSHIEAIVGRTGAEAPTLEAATDIPNVYALHGPWPRDEAYWDLLKSKAENSKVAIVWRGNEHNEYFFFQSTQPFDLYSPRVRPLMATLNILPQRQIRSKFKPHFDDLTTLLHDVQARAPAKLCVVGTPPPKADEAFLRKVMAAEPYFVSGAEHREKTIDEVEITPARVRLKLWYLVQDMLRECAEKLSVDFVEVPKEVQDDEGFLKSDYWFPDVTHANSAYGKIMADLIVGKMS